ncbi:hypothetical protein ACFE04_010082 [Oxalis oulophora]
MATLSKRLYRSLLINPKLSQASIPFCRNIYTSNSDDSDIDSVLDSEFPPQQQQATSSSKVEEHTGAAEKKVFYDTPLEDGLDAGIYKAILVGQVGQNPIEKKLKGGRTVTLLSVGTGGIRNNRRPLDHEEPKDYANRSSVQWHRVSIYPEQLGKVAMKNVVPGSILYVEGNLESKVFSDPLTGLVRRVREIAIRRNGRIVFLGKGGDGQPAPSTEMKGVGYY